MSQNIPWHRQEVFHDELDKYPQPDYFPLTILKTNAENTTTAANSAPLTEDS